MLPVDSDTTSVLSASRQPKIRVGMVLDQPFPPDARVEREAVALTEAGYEVHLLCMARPEDTQREEFYRGFYLHRVDPAAVTATLPLFNIQTRLPYKGLIKSAYRAFRHIDLAWRTLIDRFVKSYGIQVLHVHDLRLCPSGLDVAKKYRIPMVADLHENYPALMQMLKGKHNPRRGEQQRRKWEEIEYDCIHAAARVVTVADEARERLLAKGVPPEKVLVLPNTVDVEKFLNAPVDSEINRRFKSHFLLCYVGHINDRHRGIHTVLQAMAMLRDELPELAFVGAGAVRDAYMAELAPLIESAGLEDRVFFTGWLDETEFVSYIEASDVCLCPHVATDHTNATFPNKVYLYHLFKKPIITSNAVPLQRYVEQTRGGLAFESGDAISLANAIRRLAADPSLRKELGHNGYQAVIERNNWRETSRRLVGMYASLAGGLRLR